MLPLSRKITLPDIAGSRCCFLILAVWHSDGAWCTHTGREALMTRSRIRLAISRSFSAALFISLLMASPSTLMAQSGRVLDIETIMQDQNWVSSPPGGVVWSEDSKWIYFRWNPEGKDFPEIYRIPAAGGTPEPVPFEELRKLPGSVSAGFGGISLNLGGVWDEEKRRKIFSRDGDLWLYDRRTDTQTRLTFTTDFEGGGQWSADESEIFFSSGGDYFSLNPAGGELRQWVHFQSGSTGQQQAGRERKTQLQEWLDAQQLSLLEHIRKEKEEREKREEYRNSFPSPERPITVQPQSGELLSGSTISADGRFVPFRVRIQGQQGKRTVVPDYVTGDGFTVDIPARTKVGEPLSSYRLGIADTKQDTVYYVDLSILDDLVADPLGPPNEDGNWKEGRGVTLPVSPSLPVIGPDNRRAIVDVRSLDHKDRFILGIDLETGEVHIADHQHDDAWIGGPVYGLGWMPDGGRFYYMSEKTGYAHLYTRNWDGSGERALTAGSFEVYSPGMDKAKKKWFFTANDTHPGVRHFYSMPLEGGEWTRYTEGEGSHTVIVSPDEKWMADLYSRANHPVELFVKRLREGEELKQVTESTTQEWRSYNWIAPPVITFQARDGAQVPARLYKPENWRNGGPAVIFVHGAGYLQNAHKWWSSYQREYMFHHLLMQRGYIVLDIDYRASSGYGRDWRTGIYEFMGGKDLTDQVDGAAYLVREHGVDSNSIGIYGGSYGGFITLMAMFTAPDVFAAGAALRPVTDWAHYNHGYTSNILNVPQADSLAYVRSSPIYHAEGLKGALLICHGLVDTNVHAQDSIRLAQRLIELRKENWELALFPVESHGFTEPTSWMDEYKRILKLFETNLKKE